MTQTNDLQTGPAGPLKISARKKRHFKVMLTLGILVILAICAEFYASSTLFRMATIEYRSEVITNAARLVATQIDGNRIGDWLAHGADEAYSETEEKLRNILNNTPYLQYLYVYQIKPDGCHVVFDLETASEELKQYNELPEITADALGDVVGFDESFTEYIPALLRGEEIGIIESRDTFGWLLTKYERVLDDRGECVAYVGLDVSMIGVHDYNRRFMTWIIGIGMVLLLGITFAGFRLAANAERADEYDELMTRTRRKQQLLREIIEAFAKVIDLKDAYTQGHSSRVARYTAMLARELGYDEDTVQKYYGIALLHDIGKVGIPDNVLNKSGKLTDEEFDLIKSHTSRGYDVLKGISLMPEIAVGAQSHHERPDGRGYPNHLKAGEIPRVAQIIAVADCFDAMYSNRPYRKRMNFDKAVSIIREVSGTQLTPDVVDAFLRLVDRGEFRAPDDDGGGSMETVENIRSKLAKEE